MDIIKVFYCASWNNSPNYKIGTIVIVHFCYSDRTISIYRLYIAYVTIPTRSSLENRPCRRSTTYRKTGRRCTPSPSISITKVRWQILAIIPSPLCTLTAPIRATQTIFINQRLLRDSCELCACHSCNQLTGDEKYEKDNLYCLCGGCARRGVLR